MLVGEREWEKECKNVEVMYVYDKDEREELKREYGSIVCEEESGGIEFVMREEKEKVSNSDRVESEEREILIDEI